MTKSYFDPKIISTSGAPFGGTYFGFFSRLRFKAGPGPRRLVEFINISRKISYRRLKGYSFLTNLAHFPVVPFVLTCLRLEFLVELSLHDQPKKTNDLFSIRSDFWKIDPTCSRAFNRKAISDELETAIS